MNYFVNTDNQAQPMQQNLPAVHPVERIPQVMELTAQINALNPEQNVRALDPQLRAHSQPLFFHSTGPPVGQFTKEGQTGQQQRTQIEVVNQNQRPMRAVATHDRDQMPIYPMSNKPRGNIIAFIFFFS